MPVAIPKAPGIYTITNLVDGTVYVGSAVDLRQRMRKHRRDLANAKHCNHKLAAAWNECGENSFAFAVVEQVVSTQSLLLREQYYIDLLGSARSGYNINPVAGSMLGFKRSAKSNAATAAGLRGRKLTDERKAKNSEWWAGLSDGEREAIQSRRSEGLKKAHAERSPQRRMEVSANLSRSQKGRELPPEVRAKIAATLSGRKLREEHKANIAKGLRRSRAHG